MIERVYEKGGIFDAWTDYFSFARWTDAFRECCVDPLFYTGRTRSFDEILPWDHIDAGIRKEFLWEEHRKADRGVLTANCEERCAGCGMFTYGCGICPGSGKGSEWYFRAMSCFPT